MRINQSVLSGKVADTNFISLCCDLTVDGTHDLPQSAGNPNHYTSDAVIIPSELLKML